MNWVIASSASASLFEWPFSDVVMVLSVSWGRGRNANWRRAY